MCKRRSSDLVAMLVAMLLLATSSASYPGRFPPQRSSSLRLVGLNRQGFEEYENVADGTILVRIPGGTFRMGDDNGRPNERPAHTVSVHGFLMAKTPVTNKQFSQFTADTSHNAGKSWKWYATRFGERAPVVGISWYDAIRYCLWARLRLPTEAEWEYAARGRDSLIYPWGNAWIPGRCTSSIEDGSPYAPAPVGSYELGASPFGCLDMTGTAMQWCSSKEKPYPYDPADGREDARGEEDRVMRGGAWDSGNVDNYRCSVRTGIHPECGVSMGFGFRCASNAQ